MRYSYIKFTLLLILSVSFLMGCVDVTRNRENNILPWKVGVPKTEEVSSAAPLILKEEEKQFGLVLNSECPDE